MNDNRDELIKKLAEDTPADIRAELRAAFDAQDAQEAARVEQLQAELMAEYRQKTAGIKRGVYGTEERLKVKQAIRRKAAALGIPSPV